MEKKRVAIIGSTGSIGVQALEVIEEQSHRFELALLTAGRNAGLLIEQAKKFRPKTVVIADPAGFQQTKDALSPLGIKVFFGDDAIAEEIQSDNIDLVLTAIVGYAGLIPTIKAIEAGKTIALANKETLVVAGALVTELARKHGVSIYPVDSEHSAIFQCLAGEELNPIEKIILTASGGPFRGKKAEQLRKVSKADALKHPNWEMGAKITIDSASLMNKGLEVIEAKWLFGLEAARIEVIVHPQSIVHSLVQFQDGSLKAQMGLPDMKLPIQYALGYPQRLACNFPRFNFAAYPSLTFEQPDLDTFKNLALAYRALESGGNMACALNAANEVAVEKFLKDEIGFLDIAELNGYCMEKSSFVKNPSLDDYIATDGEARARAAEWVKRVKSEK